MRVLYNFILIFIALLIIWFIGLLFFISRVPKYQNLDNNTAEAAIVLTGGDKRIEEGVKILQQKLVKKLFITGVNYKVRNKKEIPYVDDLYKVDNVEIGKEATTTTGNAFEAREWIKKNHIHTIKIVTANYHMPRSILEFQYRIPDIIIEAHSVFPDKFDINKWWYDKNTLILILKEYTKYIYVLSYTKIF